MPPKASEPITSILIPEYRESNSYISYIVSINGPVRSYSLHKRYSEFDALHQTLCNIDSKIPPEELPGKSFALLGFQNSPKFLESRRLGLERYLQAILYHADPVWRRSAPWMEFFNIPSETGAGTLSMANSPSQNYRWMHEYESLLSFCAQIRAVLNERDRSVKSGNSSLAQSKKYQASKGLKLAEDNLEQLEMNLSKEKVADGEMARRRDLVSNIQNEIQELHTMTKATNNAITIAPTPSNKPSARSQLFPDEYGSPPLLGRSKQNSNRKFGNPKETEKTRMLDEKGLLQLQNQEMDMQDRVVDQLADVVRRQKEISLAISRELDEQSEIVSQIDGKIGKVEENMRIVDKKANRFLQG